MQINSFDHVLGGFIELTDATALPWVCTKLKVLDLAVAIPDMPDLEVINLVAFVETERIISKFFSSMLPIIFFHLLMRQGTCALHHREIQVPRRRHF